MEDVLDVYQRPYDPSRPVVCIDETNKQLIIEKRVPCKPGEPEKLDSVYVRNGVADIFMISEPLAGKRETVVKQTRTANAFAEILRYTADELYPKAEKIILVTDNLNIHAPSSLYKAFSAQEANRLTKRFEWHYTPKHGSWLDIQKNGKFLLSKSVIRHFLCSVIKLINGGFRSRIQSYVLLKSRFYETRISKSILA